MNEHNYKPGDKVRFIDAEAHEDYPAYYPPAGTIGTVLNEIDLPVQWPSETTSKDDAWYCDADQIEPVEEDEA